MSFAHALLPYIRHPEHHDVLFYDDHAVIINDKYPKARVHMLVMPRDLEVSRTHPLDLSHEQAARLAPYVEKAKELGGPQLKGDISIKCGVHAVPSMNNLHVHVISTDFDLPCLKHKKHYNSFNTVFFVDFGDLGTSLLRRIPRDSRALELVVKTSPMKCSYCHREFGNRFKELKQHLHREFECRFGGSP